MPGCGFEEIDRLGVARLYLGGYNVRGHHIAFGIAVGIYKAAVVAVQKAVSVDGLGPVHTLVAFQIDGHSGFAVGLCENDFFWICRHSHSVHGCCKKQK